MKNKGQIPIINPAVLVIIAIVVGFIIYHSGYNKGYSEASDLWSQELESQKGYSQQLERQLEGKSIDLDETLRELNNCTTNLDDKNSELEECQTSQGIFPLLFGVWNIYLTENWILGINIYIVFTLSLFTIKIIFSNNRK